VLGLSAVAVMILLLFDFKGVFERRASAALGKPVTVAALHVRLFPLRFLLEDLNVREPKAAADANPVMHAGHVDAGLGFWRLMVGDFVFAHLAVDDAQMLVARNADGSTNWDDAATKKPLAADAKLPEIHDLALHNTQLKYRDTANKTNLTLALETRPNKAGGEPDLAVTGKGSYEGAPTTITMIGGSILTLRDAIPYPVDLKVTSGATALTAKGTITDPVRIAGLDIALTVKGEDAVDLYRVAGVALPRTPPYQIASQVDREGQKWIFKKLIWKMGGTDLAGELTWDLSNKKPLLSGQLHAQNLNLDDMAGFIGAAPGDAKTPVEVKQAAAIREREIQGAIATSKGQAPVKPGDKNADPTANATKAAEIGAQLVIPDLTFDVEKINSMNAAVKLTAAHVDKSAFPLDNLSADVALQDGVLKLKPLSVGADKGRINLDLTINATNPYVQKTDAVAVVQNYPLQRLVGAANATTSFGAIGGRVELHGEGNSMHRILATSNGTVGLIAQGGRVSELMVQLIGLNIAKTVGLLISGDKPVAIRCLATDFAVEKGLMTARAVVFDTEPSIITGDGTVDLATEVMKMKLHPKPKSAGVGSLRVPFHLSGTFSDPSIGPDVGALTLRGGAAVVLGVLLTPLGSLLGTLEGGGGKDADCNALLAQVQQDSKKVPPPASPPAKKTK
jgi:uncharacterized protein involved in outer membrane biogenesis